MRTALLLSLLCAHGAVLAAPPQLRQVWRTEGLANPESIAAEAAGGGYYVSNVAGEADARDGVGFVSRVSADGRLLQRDWVAGLHAPKGLLLHAGKLFVSDIDALVVIEVASARIEARHAVPGATFLNDVAAGRNGDILLSDSGGARIYAFDGAGVREWLAHEELRSVNGLLPEATRLLVTTMQGKLLAVDWRSKAVTVLATGLGSADGLVRLADGSYLVGEWPGRLFHVVLPAGGEAAVSTLLDQREQQHYINDFLLDGGLLLVPNWEPSTLTAYRLD